MRRWLSGIVLAILAILFGALVPHALPTAPVPTTYTYDDSHHYSAVWAHATTQRGPPIHGSTRTTTYDAVAPLHGSSARRQAVRTYTQPAYDADVQPVQVVDGRASTEETAGVASEEFGALPGAMVAAEGAGAGRIVLGRSMRERVIPYAERTGAEYYGGTPQGLRWLPERGQVWLNKRWLSGKIKGGYDIEDVGTPRTGLPSSPYYDAEHQVLTKYGYPRYTRVDLGD